MVILAIQVGLDYREESIRVCIMNERGETLVNRNCPNDIEAVGEPIASYGEPSGIAIEPMLTLPADHLSEPRIWDTTSQCQNAPAQKMLGNKQPKG